MKSMIRRALTEAKKKSKKSKILKKRGNFKKGKPMYDAKAKAKLAIIVKKKTKKIVKGK